MSGEQRMTTNNATKNGTIKLGANLIPASTMTNAAAPIKIQLIKLNFTTETVRPKLVEGSVSVMVRQAHHEREP